MHIVKENQLNFWNNNGDYIKSINDIKFPLLKINRGGRMAFCSEDGWYNTGLMPADFIMAIYFYHNNYLDIISKILDIVSDPYYEDWREEVISTVEKIGLIGAGC